MRTNFVTLPTVHRALDDVQTASGIQASDDSLFKGAVFGRDSLEVGFDVVRWLPSLVRRIIFSLARLQAWEDNPYRDATPGKIHHEIRRNSLKRFWLPERNFFAMAIDRDPTGQPRLVTTNSSVPFELLDTRLFDDLPSDEQEAYIKGIVNMAFSEEFLTPVGVRMRGKSQHLILPHADYQGNQVSWVVTSDRTARGLRGQALPELASELESRFVNGLEISRRFIEYWYVDLAGRVGYHAQATGTAQRRVVLGTNIPENNQAWTISAAYRALLEDDRAVPIQRPVWKDELVRTIQDQVQEPLRIFVNQNSARTLEARLTGE